MRFKKRAENKKAISLMISYIILIAIGIGISVGIYAWLKTYVGGGTVPECYEGTSLIIKSYNCNTDRQYIQLNFENKGLFNIDGFFIKAANDVTTSQIIRLTSSEGPSNAVPGIYDFKEGTSANSNYKTLNPGETRNASFRYSNIGQIAKILIEPFIFEKNKTNKRILCEDAAVTIKIGECTGEDVTPSCTQNIDCNDGNVCTNDACVLENCVRTSITTCINSDGCCPASCDNTNDNDCPKLYENFTMGDPTIDHNFEKVYSNYWLAQTFTVGTVSTNENFIIKKVKFYGKKQGSPGTFYIDLKAVDEEGKPTGENLSSGHILGNSFSESGDWIEIQMSDFTLSQSTKYATMMHLNNGDPNNNTQIIYFSHTGSGPDYSGGERETSSDSGNNWQKISDTKDIWFEIWGTPA